MRTLILTTAVLAPSLLGCAQRPLAEDADAPRIDARAVTILDADHATGVAWGDLVEATATADVVIIGELHGHPTGLAAAAALWEDVLARDAAPGTDPAGKPALSLEFFDRDEQAFIDDYLLGVIDEAEFREETGRTDSNYPEGHRAMVEAARAAGARVHAANAPRRYTTVAREEGLDALRILRASQKRLFQVPESLPEGDYRDRFFDLFAGMMAAHAGDEETDEAVQTERIEGFFRAQSVWDATMADSISRAAAEGARPVVHVVGRFHADHDGGLVQALRARRPDATIVTISMDDSDAGTLAEDDAGRADFVIPVGPTHD